MAILMLLSGGMAHAEEVLNSAALGLAGVGTARAWGAGPRRPAAMATQLGYASDIGVQFAEGWTLNSAVADTPETSNLAAFLKWTRSETDPVPTLADLPGWVLEDEAFDNHVSDVRYLLGMGYRLADGLLAIGGTVTWQRLDSELQGASQDLDLDLGLAVRPFESLCLAVGVREMLEDHLGETVVEGGLWWQAIDYVGAGVDVIWLAEALEIRAGAEVQVVENLALRGGYAVADSVQELGLGLGLLWEGSRLDYGLGRIQTGPDKGAMVHSLGISIELQGVR